MTSHLLGLSSSEQTRHKVIGASHAQPQAVMQLNCPST